MHRTTAVAFLLGLAGCAAPEPEGPARPGAAPIATPRYTSDGALERPSGFESWVHVGSSLGLGYSEHASRNGPGDFHSVYTQPEVFAAYRETGRFPEKAMFILLLHEPRQRESIATQGYFQGDPVALEVAVKDRERFQEGWAYFDFGKGGRDASGRAMRPEACHRCHLEHAADDNVFVQFYPPLRKLLEARKGASVSAAGAAEPLNR